MEDSKLWHFTEAVDGLVYPVGYCRGGCPGHETAEGAREHFAQWRREQARVEPLPWDRPQCQGRDCKEPAFFVVRIPGQISSTLACGPCSRNLDRVLFGFDYATS
jgi:hypothetical protein